MTLSDISKMRACQIAWQTADAYSADIWGAVLWTQAAQMLLDMGFTDQQCRVVLRSKLARWARDWDGNEEDRLGALLRLARDHRQEIMAGEYGEGEIMEGAL